MFFGSKKRIAELETENLEIRQWLEKLNGMDAIQVAKAIEDSRAQLAALTAEVKKAGAELESACSRSWQPTRLRFFRRSESTGIGTRLTILLPTQAR